MLIGGLYFRVFNFELLKVVYFKLNENLVEGKFS